MPSDPRGIDHLLVVDVSPLWELQYTGISNVVMELAKRFHDRDGEEFELAFSIFHRVVPTQLVADAIRSRSGKGIRSYFEIEQPEENASFRKRLGSRAAALYLHTKPPGRTFDFEAQLHYDFSFLSVPECHTADTIDFHTRDLAGQVDSTDLFFTISSSTAADLSFYFGVSPDKIEVAHLGAHFDSAGSIRVHEFVDGAEVEPFFLCLGTIEPRKNVRLVLAWLRANPAILDRYRFIFAGREGWGPTFEQLVADYGLEQGFGSGRILHLGYVSEAQKTALLCTARGLIFPSLFEGFGLPVLEAMALGTPVISSCSTSLTEVLGPDGIYFDPYRLESFAAAMSTLIYEDAAGAFRARCDKLRQRSAEFTYDRCFETIRSGLDRHFFAQKQPHKSKRPRASTVRKSELQK